MSTRPDPDLLIASWLQEEARDGASDRLLAATRQQLDSTNQRRAWWPARRFSEMNNALKLAIAAAAVVVVALVGINLLPRSGGVGGPVPSPTSNPTQTPTQAPSPTPSPSTASNFNFAGGSYAAGTTYVIEDPCCVAPGRMTFTMPAAGWYAPLEAYRIGKDIPGGSGIFDLYVKPNFIDNVYTGGCKWIGTELDPPVGPTVDDLATALLTLAGPGASPPTSVTVGGHPGKRVELSIPEDIDVATTCDSYGGGSDGIFGWWVDRGGANPYVHGFGQHNTVYIVDVDGTRQVIDAMYLPGASAADRAEQDQIVASIRFEPPPASPSPSP